MDEKEIAADRIEALEAALMDCVTVLRDLGACDDPDCDEPICLHALPNARRLLSIETEEDDYE